MSLGAIALALGVFCGSVLALMMTKILFNPDISYPLRVLCGFSCVLVFIVGPFVALLYISRCYGMRGSGATEFLLLVPMAICEAWAILRFKMAGMCWDYDRHAYVAPKQEEEVAPAEWQKDSTMDNPKQKNRNY